MTQRVAGTDHLPSAGRPGSLTIQGETAGLSLAERSAAAGKAARRAAPLESHSEFSRSASRDPVGLLLGQAQSRVPELVPVRHGRMLVSPFTYYRGAALPMAADLACTPSPGLRVQLCGDAHLSNFGAFGSPERRVVFDLNDFDETLPGPFEWDVKRLVASMAVAGRENGFGAKDRRAVAVGTAAAYRTAMREFAAMPILEVWYAHFDVEDALAHLRSALPKKAVRQTQDQLAKARTRDSTQALAKLTTVADGQRQIISDPPLIVPIEELAGDLDVDAIYRFIGGLLGDYARTLPADRRRLAERFQLTRVARKVVGVGSVGTEAWILLMEPDDGLAPLLLQAKEAQRSALAGYAGESEYDNQGERVVSGQRLMQAVGDISLGWVRSTPPGRGSTDYYLRQLRDWKYSVEIDGMKPRTMMAYGRMCGWTLARAHARTGDRIAIASYLGKSGASTGRWPTSPRTTQTRPNLITPRWRRRCPPVEPRLRPGSEHKREPMSTDLGCRRQGRSCGLGEKQGPMSLSVLSRVRFDRNMGRCDPLHARLSAMIAGHGPAQRGGVRR